MGPIRPFEGACGDVPGVLGRVEIVSRDIGAALRGWRHEGPCESSGPVFGGWPWQVSRSVWGACALPWRGYRPDASGGLFALALWGQGYR